MIAAAKSLLQPAHAVSQANSGGVVCRTLHSNLHLRIACILELYVRALIAQMGETPDFRFQTAVPSPHMITPAQLRGWNHCIAFHSALEQNILCLLKF